MLASVCDAGRTLNHNSVNTMTLTSFVLIMTELANRMKYRGGILYNLDVTAIHRTKDGGGGVI